MNFFYDLNKKLNSIGAVPESTQLNERDLGKQLNEISTELVTKARDVAKAKGSNASDNHQYVAARIHNAQGDRLQAGLSDRLRQQSKAAAYASLSPAKKRLAGLDEIEGSEESDMMAAADQTDAAQGASMKANALTPPPPLPVQRVPPAPPPKLNPTSTTQPNVGAFNSGIAPIGANGQPMRAVPLDELTRLAGIPVKEGHCSACNCSPCSCNEGNAFSGAVANAKRDGIQPGEKVNVGGETYPVKEGAASSSMAGTEVRGNNVSSSDPKVTARLSAFAKKNPERLKQGMSEDFERTAMAAFDKAGNVAHTIGNIKGTKVERTGDSELSITADFTEGGGCRRLAAKLTKLGIRAQEMYGRSGGYGGGGSVVSLDDKASADKAMNLIAAGKISGFNVGSTTSEAKNQRGHQFKVNDQVKIRSGQGYASDGMSGTITRIYTDDEGQETATINVNPGRGATGTQTKMKLGGGMFGPKGSTLDLGKGVKVGGTHTDRSLSDLILDNQQGMAEAQARMRTARKVPGADPAWVAMIKEYRALSDAGRRVVEYFNNADSTSLINMNDPAAIAEASGLLDEIFYDALENGDDGPALPAEKKDLRFFHNAIKQSEPGMSGRSGTAEPSLPAWLSPKTLEIMKQSEARLDKSNLQNYVDQAQQDFNEIDRLATGEGMGNYKQRKAAGPGDEYYHPDHWTTKDQDKLVAKLKKARARGVVPSKPNFGKNISQSERDREDSRTPWGMMREQGMMEAQAPMYNVRDMKTNKVVGTHSADTGFRPSSADSGLKSHPTSIPNFHKIDRSVDLRGSMDDDEIMEAKGKKPDFLDLDKDGDKNEPMKKAAADKKKNPFKKNMSEATDDNNQLKQEIKELEKQARYLSGEPAQTDPKTGHGYRPNYIKTVRKIEKLKAQLKSQQGMSEDNERKTTHGTEVTDLDDQGRKRITHTRKYADDAKIAAADDKKYWAVPKPAGKVGRPDGSKGKTGPRRGPKDSKLLAKPPIAEEGDTCPHCGSKMVMGSHDEKPAKKVGVTQSVPKKVKEADAAPAAEKAPSNKYGFGKGIYDSLNRQVDNLITEGMVAAQSFVILDPKLIDQIAQLNGTEVEDDVVWSSNTNVTAKLMAFAKNNPQRLKISSHRSDTGGHARAVGGDSMDTGPDLTEGMSVTVNMSTDDTGQPHKDITVHADGDDAAKLAELLNLAGIHQSNQSCSGCGQSPCGCGGQMVDEEDQNITINAPSNSPDPVFATVNQVAGPQYGGGPNAPHVMINPADSTFNPPGDMAQDTINAGPGARRLPATTNENKQADLGMSLYKELQQFKGK